MDPDALGEILSSKARLRIADAISIRPRTLGELASVTGISVQGVLRHLNILAKLGVVEELPLKPRTPKARRVYAAKSAFMGDYSNGDLTVVKTTEAAPPVPSQKKGGDLEAAAGDFLVQKRRIRGEARKLGRMIDALVDDHRALLTSVDRLDLDGREKLILTVLLTEETSEEGMRTLAKHYGIRDRRSIESVLAKAKQIV